MNARPITGLREIAGRFDAVLLDQFGVLHDGARPFPGALEAVRALKGAGLRLAVLSNSGKRAAANAARLAALGFERALFDAVVTSGELCRDRLARDLAEGRLAEGARVLILSRGDGAALIEGLPLSPTEAADAAVFLVIAGREPERRSLEQDIARLAPLAARGVPCLCANTDETMYAAGGPAPGPGALAAAYAAAGGAVEWIGKPHRPVFDAALAALGGPEPARALMIGDSPAHDVAGARALGCATLLVTEGVQAGGDDAAPAADFAMPRLVW